MVKPGLANSGTWALEIHEDILFVMQVKIGKGRRTVRLNTLMR